jgi:F-type H+-transporting ATPase subunit a
MMPSLMTFLAQTNPVDHVVNQHFRSGDAFGMHDVWLWSAHVGNLILSGVITILLLSWAAGKIATGPESQGHDRYVTRNPFAHAIEVVISYLRDNTVRPLLGERTDRYMPFLLTIFFFILINNLLGLTPITDTLHLVDGLMGGHFLSGLLGATATQNIFVTAAMAILAGIVINISGLRELGIAGYAKHLTGGTAPYLWPLMIPIEIMGTFIKPVALALRLFANMTAGHILVAVLFMFAVQGLGLLAKATLGGVVLGGVITGLSAVGAIGVYFLELFVAFLQAFVFMFLTAVFIAQLSHHGEHEHHEEHGHEHAHA